MATTYKPCIACAEEIKLQAKLCRFCGTKQFAPARTKATAQDSVLVSRSRDALNASWVLFGGPLVWVLGGFHPNGIYGPMHPYATFVSGVAVASLLLTALASALLAVDGNDKKRSLLMKSIKRGSLVWFTISLFFVLILVPMTISYYQNS
jgi:hypothetical protein